MNILQFLRIFWARRAIVLIAMAASVFGAFVVVLIVQPRYEATSRVMMSMLVRPDPVTGEVLNEKTAGTYFESQMELIADYSVTGRVVDQLGMLSDPGQIRAYANRPKSDTRDFRRWLAQNVADSTKAKIAGSGSVLEITYRAATPQAARTGAEILRQTYIEQSLASRRAEASKNASFYNNQADVARKMAETAETAKAAYEKSTGIIMQGRDSDLDSERLASLAGQASIGQVGMAAPVTSQAALQLAQIDAQLAEASKRLGPNHPEILDLQAKRATMAKVAAADAAASRAASSGVSGAAALARALQDQKGRVIAQRDELERMRQLQGEVDLRRDQYRSASARAAQFSLEAAVSDNGLSPLGIVVTPPKPAFPNKPLILGGALGLGFAMGLALALLLELLNRRVRSVEDLRLSSEIHCIAVVEEPSGKSTGRRLRRALRGLIPQWVGAPA